MHHIRSATVILLSLMVAASLGMDPASKPSTKPGFYSDAPWAFIDNYRIAYYLDLAVDLQNLNPEKRAIKLRELATESKRTPDVFPLCRMLFEAKPKTEFRSPMLGAPGFVGGGDHRDWPLDPITLFDGVPILIVDGYSIGGHPEDPDSYVDYCLKECGWRETKFTSMGNVKLKEIVEKFIGANPKLDDNKEWFRRQAE